MAEFCKECAKELGFYEYDEPPLFCEHCGKLIEKESVFKKIIKWLKIKQLWS